MSETSTYRWLPERQIAYPLIQEVALSPDGRRVLYVVREPLLTDEKSEFISHIYLAQVDGGDWVQLTFGDHRNSVPRWSPDGTTIAFLSNRGGKTNVYAMRASGGEAWALTRYEKSDVGALLWSPGGDRLGFLMGEPPLEEKEKAQKARDDAVQFDKDFTFAHLFTVPFSVGPRTLPEVTQVTRGRYHVVGFEWLPEGDALAVTYRPTPIADLWPETRLGTVPADGSAEPAELGVIANYSAPRPLVSPNGAWIACSTGDQPVRWAFSARAVLYPVHGGATRPLAYTPDSQTELIGWSGDGQELYVWDWSGVTTGFWALPISGEPARPLTTAPLLKTLPASNTQGDIAFVGQDLDQPNAVYVLDGATPRKVVQPPLPTDWPESAVPRAEVIRWQAPDGKTIEGIVSYPLDYQPGRSYPLIVNVHGGPTGVFVRNFLGSFEGYANLTALAERGYVVLRPNPRGSSGYGRDFRFANYQDWGHGDFRDIMAGVDHLIAQGVADPDRLGILGWSYGGFMTSWTITQTDRFKAACVGAAVTNPISFNGTADIPSFIPDYFGAEFWDDLNAYPSHSPVLNARGVSTPALIQHGEADVRVPVSQGYEFYNALKRRGVPVEMVVYPRQDHAFDEPRLIIDMRRRAVAWFDRWIRGTDPA